MSCSSVPAGHRRGEVRFRNQSMLTQVCHTKGLLFYIKKYKKKYCKLLVLSVREMGENLR